MASFDEEILIFLENIVEFPDMINEIYNFNDILNVTLKIVK